MDAGTKSYIMFSDEERKNFGTVINMLSNFARELVTQYDLDYFCGLYKDTESLISLMNSYLYKYDG